MPTSDSNPSRIRLVTRGDDAGSCESANVAIRQAACHGVLRNVSVMAPGPAFEAAVPLLQSLPESVCLGLHVTLNAEWETVKWPPVLPRDRVPSLVDESGYFWPTPAETQKQGVRVDEMLAEIEAQLARVRKQGLTVSYIDEHMGVSWPGRSCGRGSRSWRGGRVWLTRTGCRGCPTRAGRGEWSRS